MKCPFEPCDANLPPLTTRTDPHDASATVTIYPIHVVVGESSWFGRCPASQLIVPKLTRAGRDVLTQSKKVWTRMLLERAAAETAREEQARARPETVSPTEGNVGRTADHPRDEYFPVRPAEGPGDMDIPERKGPTIQGGPSMDSMDMQMNALINLAISGFGGTQDRLARITAMVEVMRGLIAEATVAQQAAHSLALAAVGNAARRGSSGASLMLTSVDMSSAAIDSARDSIELLANHVQVSYLSLNTAVDAGRSIQQTIGNL